MKATIKIYSKGKQSQLVNGKRESVPTERTLFTTSYHPDTDNYEEGLQMCKDYALYLMGKRKQIGISRDVTVPSSLYFSIELEGFTLRSDSSETQSQWKGLFSIPTSKLKSKDGVTVNIPEKFISLMTNRLEIASDIISSVPEAQAYADRKQAERLEVSTSGELVNA